MDSENGTVHIHAVYAEIREEIALAHRSLCDDIDAVIHLLEDGDPLGYMNGVIEGLQKGIYTAKGVYTDLINRIVYDLMDEIGDDKDVHISKVFRK